MTEAMTDERLKGLEDLAEGGVDKPLQHEYECKHLQEACREIRRLKKQNDHFKKLLNWANETMLEQEKK